jgi:hypothetical protein
MILVALITLLGAASPIPPGPEPEPRWGFLGHEMTARVAAAALPDEMPDFFTEAGEHFAYLAPEPDRWKDRSLQAMDQAWTYDHYIDFENLPPGAVDEPDRFTFLAALYEVAPYGGRLEKPERDAGFLPFRILELYQRLATEWRLWSEAPEGSERRRWIEDRIINDAGILGHYVTDGSQPHHTTIHFNGWDSGTPNPQRSTSDRGFHSRFERFFVDAHVTQADVARRMSTELESPPEDVRDEVFTYLYRTFSEVERLYRLERDVGFDPERAASPAARDFTADRLAAGAQMLRVLWWSAWLEGVR